MAFLDLHEMKAKNKHYKDCPKLSYAIFFINRGENDEQKTKYSFDTK